MDKKPLKGEYTCGQAAESFWEVACELFERLDENLGEEWYALLKKRLGIALAALAGLIGLARLLGALGAGKSFLAGVSEFLGWLGLLLLGGAFLTGIGYLYLERARAAGLGE